MVSATHGPSCRCANCRANRETAKMPQVSVPVKPFSPPTKSEGEWTSTDIKEQTLDKRRAQGLKTITYGVILIAVAIFVVEGIQFLIWRSGPSFGYINGLFVALGALQIAKGIYQVVKVKNSSNT